MKKYLLLGALAIVLFSFAPIKSVFAYTWVQQGGSGSRWWTSLASSSDGTKLAATGQSGYIYTSTDSGVTWTAKVGAGIHSWASIASSSDGTKLAAVEYGGYIYTSTDSGTTWVMRTGSGARTWESIASSSDGIKLVAADFAPGGKIYTSTDGGTTWIPRIAASVSSSGWLSIASSSDGTKLIAADYADYLYTSADSGMTWTPHSSAGARLWQGLASSSDGSKLVAIVNGGGLYTSVDSGTTWIAQTGVGTHIWTTVASSSDGTKILAGTAGSSGLTDYLYFSADGGATWTTQTGAGMHGWTSVIMSSDGLKLAAGTYLGYIWTSNLPATSFSVTTDTPSSVAATGAWLNGTMSSPSLVTVTAFGFNYGATTSYGTTVSAPVPIVPGYGSGFTVNVVLSCGTTYHYRAYATVSGTTLYGADMIFTTLSCSSGITLPSVLTVSVDTILATQANLQGKITSFGGAASAAYGFDYGLTTAYGTTTLPAAIPSYLSNFTVTPLGLACGTLYHFRAYATNSAGTVHGADMTFTTSFCSTFTVYTNPVTSVTPTGASMWGSYTVSGSMIVNTFGFDLGPTTTYGMTVTTIMPTAPVTVSASFGSAPATLMCNTTYHYRAFATFPSLPTMYGADMTFTTLPCLGGTPSVTTLAATSITANSAVLNGTYGYFPGGSTSGFNYGTSLGYGSTLAATFSTVDPTYFSASLTGLACNTTYHFRGFLNYYSGWSGIVNGGDLTFTTLPCSNPIVVTLAATLVTANTAVLNGSLTSLGSVASSSNVGFQFGTTPYTAGPIVATPTPLSSPGSFSFTFVPAAGLVCNTTYHYRAIASTTSGSPNVNGADMTFTTLPCPAWTHSSTQRNWVSSAISSDGLRSLAGVDSGYVSTSNTYGVLWTEHPSVGSHFWESAASSADGMKLVTADVTPGYIYTSTDGGTTWTPRMSSGSRQWTGLASSADGTKLIAVGGGNAVYISNDSGVTWSLHSPVTGSSAVWSSAASSTDGLHLAITSLSGTTGYIYTSSNGGATWTQRTAAGMRNWQGIASSAGGMKLAAVARGAAGTTLTYYVYTSTDGGATWNGQIGSGLRYWSRIASSYDGSRLAAIAATDVAGLNGTLYLSSDSGVNWTPVTTPGVNRWSSVSLSCDATHMIATTYSITPSSWLGGYIWAGNNIFTPSPCTTESYVAVAPRTLPSTNELSVPTSELAGTITPDTNRLTGFALGAFNDATASVPTDSNSIHTASTDSVPSPSFQRTLRYGSEGEDVMHLQKLLKEKGYLSLEPTGYYGLATIRAVKQLQSAQGLETAGTVGPKTLHLLNSQI